MAMSNSCGIETLKFDDTLSVLLSKDVHKKSSGAAETPRNALSVEKRRRSMNKDKKKESKSKSRLGRSKSQSRGWSVGSAARRGFSKGLQVEER